MANEVTRFVSAVEDSIKNDEYICGSIASVGSAGYYEVNSCKICDIDVVGSSRIEMETEDGSNICLDGWNSIDVDHDDTIFKFDFGGVIRVFDFSDVAA